MFLVSKLSFESNSLRSNLLLRCCICVWIESLYRHLLHFISTNRCFKSRIDLHFTFYYYCCVCHSLLFWMCSKYIWCRFYFWTSLDWRCDSSNICCFHFDFNSMYFQFDRMCLASCLICSRYSWPLECSQFDFLPLFVCVFLFRMVANLMLNYYEVLRWFYFSRFLAFSLTRSHTKCLSHRWWELSLCVLCSAVLFSLTVRLHRQTPIHTKHNHTMENCLSANSNRQQRPKHSLEVKKRTV